ncbi:hypothetical protein ACLE20_08605 [Rhizobium sp. YIM 134829]|jgi:hypothetical protein|uniref:hypothetical protein n=1 Tax=Rhizobium sp. YIM 134829 TaxID=3390453 RepID=UPI003979A4C4
MSQPHFTLHRLVPSEVEESANRLAEHVAGVHLETGEFSIMTITVEDVVIDGMPMGSYEVEVKQIKKPEFLELSAED